MSGLGAVAWKEWRCLATRGNRSQLLLPLAAIAFVPAVASLEMGRAWLADPILPSIVVIATALIMVGVTIPDAFAGERERRTLATLLASPLGDGAILAGKLLVPVAASVLVTVGLLVLSVVLANLADWNGSVALFPPAMLLALPAMAAATGLFTAALGVLVSLRASTVQSAQQVLVSALMTPLMVGGVAFMLAATSGGPPPDWITSADTGLVILAGSAVMAVADAAILALVVVRFRRSRLIVLE